MRMNKKQNNTSQNQYAKEREKIKREYQEYIEKRNKKIQVVDKFRT